MGTVQRWAFAAAVTTLGATVGAATPPPKKLPPGTVCLVSKVLNATTATGGKGDKHKIPKGTKLTVHESEKAWTKVTSGDATLFLKAQPLVKGCKPVAVEPGTTAPAKGEDGGGDGGEAPKDPATEDPATEDPADKPADAPAEQA